jgi:uncharacterized protein YjgD (DUF1641 family)
LKFVKLYIFYLAICTCFGQNKADFLPKAKFFNDTLRLGETVAFSVVINHKAADEVFFPDADYNYKPFEFVDKNYFPTKTQGGVSKDSAVYWLRTFSVDTLLNLSLPIYVYKNKDSLVLNSNFDTIRRLNEISGGISKKKILDVLYLLPMKTKANLLVLAFQLILASMVAFLWWVVFGKTVIAQFKLLAVYRNHVEFIKNFNRLTSVLNKQNLVKAMAQWKQYIGKLQQKSFTTMTTTEIINNLPQQNLPAALREIDQSIYGNEISKNLPSSISVLREMAELAYIIKKKEIK